MSNCGRWARFMALLFVVALLVAVLARADAEPAIWKAQGPHATVYLFGSVHLLKKTTQWRSQKFNDALTASSSVWEEVSNADDAAAAQPLIIKYGIDMEHSLSSKLDAHGNAKLESVATSLGLPMSQLNVMQPWLAAIQLTGSQILKAGYDPRSGVDLTVKSLATSQGKPVMGFETLEQQIQYFANLPQALQIQDLLSTLDEVPTIASATDNIVDAWVAGDTAKLQALFNGGLVSKYPQLYDVLLVQRNKLMARDIENLLRGNAVSFVCVGAGHLVGADSIQSDLSKDGFNAIRL